MGLRCVEVLICVPIGDEPKGPKVGERSLTVVVRVVVSERRVVLAPAIPYHTIPLQRNCHSQASSAN
jgi:hypothetical protein